MTWSVELAPELNGFAVEWAAPGRILLSQRNRLYREMAKVIENYAPWRLDISRYRNQLAQPWVLGYKKHPILRAEWQYIDVAPRAK